MKTVHLTLVDKVQLLCDSRILIRPNAVAEIHLVTIGSPKPSFLNLRYDASIGLFH